MREYCKFIKYLVGWIINKQLFLNILRYYRMTYIINP